MADPTPHGNPLWTEDAITRFRGDNNFLSNFFTYPLAYAGRNWPTAEHANQASKTSDPESRAMIAVAITPAEAKKLGRSVTLRPDWDQYRLLVMRDIIAAKFPLGSKLARALLDTGTATLVEGNNWGDTYWGTVNGIGDNHLGRLLMFRRAELAGDTLADLSGSVANLDYRIYWLLNWANLWDSDGVFTFPDGESWRLSEAPGDIKEQR